MARNIATTDGGNNNEHKAADLETVIVDPEDVIEMFRRNARDEDQQRSHVLRVSPPFEGDKTATLHVSEDQTYYPPEMDSKPIHLGATHLFAGRPDGQLDDALCYPDINVERSLFRDHYDVSPEDADEDEWEEWWDTAVEVWESNVRNAMQEPVEIELGGMYADQPTTTVEVRFESDDA